MPRFKNKGGPHSETLPDGTKKVYGKGEEFDSRHDLVAVFGPEKFDKLSDAAPTPASPDGPEAAADDTDRGDEVTDQFDNAPAAGVRVFKRGRVYSVYNEGDMTSPTNEDEFTRKGDVEAYIDDLQ